MIFKRFARAVQRSAIKRRIRYWGEMLERLEQQARSHAGNVEIALSECALAKRELAMLDGPAPRISMASGRGMNDGVRRFTLIEDRPHRTPIVRKTQLHQWAGK